MSDLEYTVHEIYRLAHEYENDIARYELRTLQDVYDATQRIPYRRDLDMCGVVECVKRPHYGARGGDCDDKTVFAGAALTRLGFAWKVKTVSYVSSGEMQHVYPIVWVDGSWRAFDATYPDDRMFEEHPYTRAIVWRQPVRRTTVGNVTTLEGSVGIIPVAAIATIASSISKIGDLLAQLPLIGSIFRGKTTHVPYDEAVARQRAIGNEWVTLYNALPQDAQAQLYQFAQGFYITYFKPAFGDWWDNIINNDYASWQIKGFLSTPQSSVYHWLSMPVFYILAYEDATRVEQSIQNWYTQPITEKVYAPLNVFMHTVHGVTLESLDQTASGGTAPAKSSGAGILLAAGAAALFFMTTKRGSRSKK